MVRLRLSKVGRLHVNMFRLVACDQKSRRDGKNLEVLGIYNPHGKTQEEKLKINADRVRHWLSNGAQPSDNVWNLLRKQGINKTHLGAKS